MRDYRIKIDTLSWLILSGAITLVILIIALFATTEYPYSDAPMFTIQFLALIVFSVFFQRVGIIKNKPPMDKYEITLFVLISGLVGTSTLLMDLRILNFGLIILFAATIVTLLITIAYHVDRKAQWEKEQQALQHSTLQK